MFRCLIVIGFLISTPLLGDSLEGIYQVRGYDPYAQSEYIGTAKLTKKGEIFEAVWDFADISQLFKGTGFREGNSLVFVFINTSGDIEKYGVQYYTIQNGVLEGSWTLLHGDKKGTETLRRMKNSQSER